MLGSLSEADDAVQEAWLRLSRSDADAVANLGGWLTTVVARVCLDMLRARRSRREELVGTWLPEPILSTDEDADPAHQAELADSVGSPCSSSSRRCPPPSASPSSCTTCSACRSRRSPRSSTARRRRRASSPAAPGAGCAARRRRPIPTSTASARSSPPSWPPRARATSTRCSRCSTPTSSSASTAGAARTPGRPRWARRPWRASCCTRAPRFAPLAHPAIVNGAAGLYLGPAQRPAAVVGFTVAGGRIAAIDLIVDREKLRQVIGD